ncbi:MAG: acetate--CoA ligase family protein [Rhodospirillaceae bacterium]|nr:acetate--CoA ligase family protein [Rhodospirillaceae bacterium]
MKFEENAAKALLQNLGLLVPEGAVVTSPSAAADAAAALGGRCMVKAQAPIGKRGRAGGIRPAESAEEARGAAEAILGMEINGYRIDRLLVEQQVPIAAELYAAVLSDAASCRPVVLFSTMGGVDVEETAAADPDAVRRILVDIRTGLTDTQASDALAGLDLCGQTREVIARFLVDLYDAYRALDADLLEINPLALTEDGQVIVLDCKYVLDDSSINRQAEIAAQGSSDSMTTLEAAAASMGIKYMALEGNVGVLANGAGLTMATMDAIAHFGGAPANFLEIGGEAYTKAETALSILLKNHDIRSLLISFCGAFARTDVMARGVVSAWKKFNPEIPVFFTVHGTGEKEAIELIRRELGRQPFDSMDDAVRAAVSAANGAAA